MRGEDDPTPSPYDLRRRVRADRVTGAVPASDCSAGKQNAGCDYRYTIHALDLLTGGEKTSRVVQVTYPGYANYQLPGSAGTILFQAALQTQRPGLVLTNGSLYLCFGSFKDDDNPYHDWMMRSDAVTLTQQAVYNSTPNAEHRQRYWPPLPQPMRH